MRAPTLLAAALSASRSISALQSLAQDAASTEVEVRSQPDSRPCSTVSSKGLEPVSSAQEAGSACNVQSGDYELEGPAYPESCHFVPPNCELVCSQLFEAIYIVFDAVKHTAKRNLSIPETEGNLQFHASGVRYDEKNRRLTTLHNDGAAFYTSGLNVDGDNWIAHWDVKEDYKLLWKYNLNNATGLSTCRGYQEVIHLPDGRIIAVSTYGGCLVLVTHNDEGVNGTEILYKTKFNETSKPFPAGTGAIDQINATAYLFNDQNAKTLNVLNLDNGKNTTTQVKLLNGLDKTGDDGLAVPKRFQGKCSVVAGASEGWFFWCSRDGWQSAELIGTMDNKYANGGAGEGDLATKNGSSTAIYEIFGQGETGENGNSLVFGNYEFFMDAGLGLKNETLQGTRTKFPQEDLTSQLDTLYEKFQSNATSPKVKQG